MNIEDSRKWAEGFYRGVIIVADYMEETRKNLIDTLINPSDREVTIKGMFLRGLAWMQTLKKLNRVCDFQAIVSGNRALLEITVDILLLHQDKSNDSWWKMYCWEQSAKLKSAENLERYYRGSVPNEYQQQINFIRDQKTMIENMRNRFWNGKHPLNRWTGKPGLLEDVQIVDSYFGNEIRKELGSSLEQFYETEYRRINWSTHGSALASIRDLSPEEFHVMSALAFKWCADLAMLCTKTILIDFEFASHYSELADKWKEVKENRLLAYADSQGWLNKIDET